MTLYADEAVEFSSYRGSIRYSPRNQGSCSPRATSDAVSSRGPRRSSVDNFDGRSMYGKSSSANTGARIGGVEDFVKTLYQRFRAKETDSPKFATASTKHDVYNESARVTGKIEDAIDDDLVSPLNSSYSDSLDNVAPASFSDICLTAVDQVGTMEQLLAPLSPSSLSCNGNDSLFSFNDVIFPTGGDSSARPSKRKQSTKVAHDDTQGLTYYQRTKLLRAKQLRDTAKYPSFDVPECTRVPQQMQSNGYVSSSVTSRPSVEDAGGSASWQGIPGDSWIKENSPTNTSPSLHMKKKKSKYQNGKNQRKRKLSSMGSDRVPDASSPSVGPSSRRCTNCQLCGHDRRNCPKPRFDEFSGEEIKFQRKCSKCGEFGHDRRLCGKFGPHGSARGQNRKGDQDRNIEVPKHKISVTQPDGRSSSLGLNSAESVCTSFEGVKGGTKKQKLAAEESSDMINVPMRDVTRRLESPLNPEKTQEKQSKSNSSLSTKTLKEKLKKFTQERAANAELNRTQRLSSLLFSENSKSLSSAEDSTMPVSLAEVVNSSLISIPVNIDPTSHEQAENSGVFESGMASEGSGDESELSSAANSTFDSPQQIGMKGGIVPSLLAPLLSSVNSAPNRSSTLNNTLSSLNGISAATPGSLTSVLGQLDTQEQQHVYQQLFQQQQLQIQQSSDISNTGHENSNVKEFLATFLSQQKMATMLAMNLFKAAENKLLESQQEK